MEIAFNDTINGIPCVVTVNAGKKSKIVKVEGVEKLPEPIQKIYEKECSNAFSRYREYSENERSEFFRGRCISGDSRKELEKAYQEWENSFKNGTSDPNWCDGTGLNMIRQRIIMLKSVVQDLCLESEYPECFYQELPPQVASDYIAGKEELIKTGYLYADKLENEPILAEIKDVASRTQCLYQKMCSADKWGSLRNIHWLANLPVIYREICSSKDVTKLPKLKCFRQAYDVLLAKLKETLDRALIEEKEKSFLINEEENAEDEETGDDITESWCQMSIFDFLTA